MDFFGMGMGEIALILIVALIIFGPGKLPEIARTISKFTRDMRKMSTELKTAVNKEINILEEEKRNAPVATTPQNATALTPATPTPTPTSTPQADTVIKPVVAAADEHD